MEEFLNKRKSRLVAVSLLIILSVVVIFAGSRLYSQYREQVIRTEESQLLTMAGIVGNNLNSYMEQQLEEIDLFYSQEGMPENVWAEYGGINARTAYFLKENAGVYNWITVTEPDGTKFRYEPGKKTFRQVQPTVTLTVGLWDSLPHWCPV